MSNLKSSLGQTFGMPSKNSPRFIRERGNITPGPGQYKYTLGLGVGGAYQARISTLNTPAASTFYHSERRLFNVTKEAKSNNI